MKNQTGDILVDSTWSGCAVLPLLCTHFLSVRLVHSDLHFFSVSTLLSYQGMKKGARSEVKKMGPLKVAHLNGLSVSRQPMHNDIKDVPERASNDERVGRMNIFLTCFMKNGSVKQM